MFRHARQAMQRLGAKLMGIIETAGEAVAKLLFTTRQSRKTEFATRHIAGRRINARHDNAGSIQPLAQIAGGKIIGKLTLDSTKAGPRRRIDAIGESMFGEEHGNIGAKAQMPVHGPNLARHGRVAQWRKNQNPLVETPNSASFSLSSTIFRRKTRFSYSNSPTRSIRDSLSSRLVACGCSKNTPIISPTRQRT